MVRNLRHIYKADIIAKRGYGIDRLRKYIEHLDINQYEGILIIIGTNDLTDKQVWFQYLKEKHKPNYKLKAHATTNVSILKARYQLLIDLIKSKNPNIKIELSPIIPRLFDYEVNLQYLKQVNNMIKELCRTKNCYHDRTLIKSFLKSGKPDPELYDRDGLHLSLKGSDKLISILRCKLPSLT